MRRLFCLLLSIILSMGVTLGEAALELEDSEFLLCRCNTNPCDCFIREGDGHHFVQLFTERLIENGYLSSKHALTIFDDETTAALKAFQADNNIEQSGTFDDETLFYLLGEATDDQLLRLIHLIGLEKDVLSHVACTECGKLCELEGLFPIVKIVFTKPETKVLDALRNNHSILSMYIPTDGGEKIHLDPACSEIKFPRMISVNTAAILLTADERILCGKCCQHRFR